MGLQGLQAPRLLGTTDGSDSSKTTASSSTRTPRALPEPPPCPPHATPRPQPHPVHAARRASHAHSHACLRPEPLSSVGSKIPTGLVPSLSSGLRSTRHLSPPRKAAARLGSGQHLHLPAYLSLRGSTLEREPHEDRDVCWFRSLLCPQSLEEWPAQSRTAIKTC